LLLVNTVLAAKIFLSMQKKHAVNRERQKRLGGRHHFLRQPYGTLTRCVNCVMLVLSILHNEVVL